MNYSLFYILISQLVHISVALNNLGYLELFPPTFVKVFRSVKMEIFTASKISNVNIS